MSFKLRLRSFFKFNFNLIYSNKVLQDVSQNIGFQLLYKGNELNQLIRKKQFNLVDFMSFVGGILGLFAGFSALSFVELIYWFTIRVFITSYKKVDSRVYSISGTQDENPKLARVKKFLKSYFTESSVHGLGYIFEFSWISG